MLTGNNKQIERSATARTATGTAYPTKPDRSRSHPFVDHDYDHDYDPATRVSRLRYPPRQKSPYTVVVGTLRRASPPQACAPLSSLERPTTFAQ